AVVTVLLLPMSRHPAVMPQLESQQRPKGLAMVSAPAPVLVEKPLDEDRAKPTLALEPFGIKLLGEQRAQLVAHPSGNRHGKSALLTMDDLLGKPRLNRLLQDVLHLKTPDLQRGWKPRSELYQSMVKERSTHFQRACHAGTINFH